MHEQDKFDILFEKRFINFICEKLRENIGATVEIEQSDIAKKIVNLISNLVNHEEFNQKKVCFF